MSPRMRTTTLMLAAFALLGLGAGALHATSRSDAPVATPPSVAMANWTFSGCWSPNGNQPCYDIFTDSSGQHWKCKQCGQTGNPSPGKCTPISQAQLNNGRWCS